MIIELHAIQSFAPGNLNRDDTGAPKEAVFGGVRRARVSSQSWKRAIRVAFREGGDVELGTRTKRAHEQIVARILRTADVPAETASHRASVLLSAEPLKLKLVRGDEEGEIKTGQLLFFRDADLDTLARLAVDHGAELDSLAPTISKPKDDDGPKRNESRAKQGEAIPLPKALVASVRVAMTTPSSALDIALFGRMVAELPEGNVDAACQVAHALGTHRLSAEFDYYTAVDDLKPEDTEGADMIGTIAFNASCFYRYAVVDTDQLASNLGAAADREHLVAAVERFVRAFVTAAPSGKQSSFAARNLPTAVLAVTRLSGAMNLANAFVVPIDRRREDEIAKEGVAKASVIAMLCEFKTLERMYGAHDESTQAVLLSAHELDGDGDVWVVTKHLDDLVERVTARV